jgi:hypothetical protein
VKAAWHTDSRLFGMAFETGGPGYHFLKMTGSELLRLPLSCDRLAPSRARDAVKQLDAIDGVRDDAMLIVSELVSSAVLEGEGHPRETIELIASEVPEGVELVVATQGSAVRPHPAAMSASVVAAVARSWGLAWQGERTQLWAQLAV